MSTNIEYPNIGDFKLRGGYKAGKIEAGFQTELMSLLRNVKDYICFHPADIGLLNKFLDVHFITKNGNCHWLELKQIKGDTFNVKKFEDDQVLLLRELEYRNPEIARVGIYSKKNNKYKILKFSEIWNSKNNKGGVKIFNKKKG